LLDYAIRQTKKKSSIVIYFHNLKYDYHTIVKNIHIEQNCIKDGLFYSCNLIYKGKRIQLRDSYKIFPFALCTFQQNLGLSDKLKKQEAIAYNYYRVSNVSNKKILVGEYIKHFEKKSDKILFEKILKENEKLFEFKDGFFNPIKYYIHYLKYDCLVLCEGIRAMRLAMKKVAPKLDLFNYLTISSFTNHYMSMAGSFDGMFEMTGSLRDFCGKAVTGGRVMVNKKYKKQIIEKKIADFDGVSLYPSAIKRICDENGFSEGKCKILNKSNLDDVIKNTDNFKYYIIKIKITKINKKQQMPMVSYKDKTGKLIYTNSVPKDGIIVYVDKTTLQDWIEFQKIKYEIIEGVYWDGKYNKKFGNAIEHLFKERLKYKKQKKQAMQLCLKLMMNSGYGKTIVKKSFKRKIIVQKDKLNIFYNKYYHLIKEVSQINDRQYEAVLDHTDDTNNLAHVGTAVLSMSKRIMNELFDVANSNQYVLYYTDTDSIHMDYDDVEMLAKKYEEKYNRKLVGKKLGQFHIDFNMKNSSSEIYAIKSIFLGSKCYIDVLESKNKQGKTIRDIHYRMKGITVAGLNHEAKKYCNGMFGLYTDLIKTAKNILLNPKGSISFGYKGHRVYTKKKFKRKLKF